MAGGPTTAVLPVAVEDPAQVPSGRHKLCAAEAAKRPGPREALCGLGFTGPQRAPAPGAQLRPMCADLWPGHLADCLPCLRRRAGQLGLGGRV